MRKVLDVLATIVLLTLTIPMMVLLFLMRYPANYLKQRNYGR